MSFRIAAADDFVSPTQQPSPSLHTPTSTPRTTSKTDVQQLLKRYDRPTVYKGDKGDKGDQGDQGDKGDTISNYVVFRKTHEPNSLVFVLCEPLVDLKCIQVVARGKGKLMMYFPSGHVLTQGVTHGEFNVYELDVSNIIFPPQFSQSQLIYVFSHPEPDEMVEVMMIKVVH